MKQKLKYLALAVQGALLGALTLRAEFGPQEAETLQANADLSACQYHIVRRIAANLTNIASDATQSGVFGVLQNKPTSGQAGTVAYQGRSKVVAGGALTDNVIFTSNSSGRAAVVASGQMALGRIMETAGADGDIVTCQLMEPVRWTGAA